MGKLEMMINPGVKSILYTRKSIPDQKEVCIFSQNTFIFFLGGGGLPFVCLGHQQSCFFNASHPYKKNTKV